MDVRRAVRKEFKKPSRTRDSSKDSTDINLIMRKYEKTGLITHLNKRNAVFGDFSNVQDYQTACQAVIEANNAFMTIPARVRARFGNDPGQLIAFLANPANDKEAVQLGLKVVKEVPPSPPVASPEPPEAGS